MLGRYSRSQPFFCLFIQKGCAGRSKDKERQKPIKPGEGHGQTTFVVWSIWFLVRVVEKGGFCQERKVSIWKEMRRQIMEWHGNYPSSPGICGAFVCLFVCFFQNHCNCPTVEAGGRGFIQRPHGEAGKSVQMPDPRTIAFYCHLWLRPKLQQCYQILFEGDVCLKCILLARNVVFKIGWIHFFILWKKGWDK